ncbi:MAG: TlyA family RNA methyltransferase [Lachnospiraceae bacterium]|nr:TlyA family RNA methyltransferase [Lachnospiraceae bacterium]
MKERLDVLLVKQNLAESREKAKALIMSGIVYVNGQKEDKAGSTFEEETSTLEVRGSTLKYVSRGGLKLEKAMAQFPVTLEDAVCMDIGASTGGFTDCMLQNGAKKVFAIDVGHGQLAWKLRNDERVVCMEKTNFRYVEPKDIGEEVDFASVDVSFISLSKILPAAYPILRDGGQMVCLIKPQFEAGRDKVGKKGVVREPEVHEEVIENVFGYIRETGFKLLGLTYSPVRGPEGNIEYLVYIAKTDAADAIDESIIKETVQEAHKTLEKEPS